jgi:hypothetical protein
VSNYLLVANQTLGGTALAAAAREHAKYEHATIHVVVPATEPADEQPPTKGTAPQNAERRLQEALGRLRAVGIQVTGEVGDADPMQAIRDALGKAVYTGLIISTLPAGASRWLHRDLLHRAAGEFNLPIEWIEARTDAADEKTYSLVEPRRFR